MGVNFNISGTQSKTMKIKLPKATKEQIELGRDLIGSCDEHQIDDDALISEIDDGIGSFWIQSWVYVFGGSDGD